MRSEVTSMEADWEQIAPELEAAVGKLGKADRDVVLLRFYEQRPLAEVGQCLGISEKAAQKRVERAVGKLRRSYPGRGWRWRRGVWGRWCWRMRQGVEGVWGVGRRDWWRR